MRLIDADKVIENLKKDIKDVENKPDSLAKDIAIKAAEFLIQDISDVNITPTACDIDKVRADMIDEVKGLAQHYLIGMMDLENATKYGNKNAEQQDISYGTLMRYEIADCVDGFLDSIEGLKEKKDEG